LVFLKFYESFHRVIVDAGEELVESFHLFGGAERVGNEIGDEKSFDEQLVF
jgi:hypothetical protein